MSILGKDGNPISSSDSREEKNDQSNDPKEKEIEPLTEEEMEKLAEEYENEVLAILPAQLFVIYEANKESKEQLPPKLCVRNAETGEIYTITKDLSRITESEEFHASVHMLSVKTMRRQQLMNPISQMPSGMKR